MSLCTYCGMILTPSEVDGHSKLSQIDHDANLAKMKALERTTSVMKAV